MNNTKMLKRVITPAYLLPMRAYATRKDIRMRRTLLKQDVDIFPVHSYPKPKRTDHRVYVWGMAATGALGVKQSLRKQESKNAHVVHHPTRQPFAERFDVLDMASGYGFTLFATKPDDNGNTLFGTGINTDSQIGFHKLGGVLNKPMDILIYPAPIALSKTQENGTTKEDIRVNACAAGRAHAVVLTETGTLFTLGNNAYGQCARPIIEDEKYGQSHVIQRIDNEVFVNSVPDDAVKNIVCGQDHSLFLMKSGRLFSCGWGADGQTGLGHYNSTETPSLVGGDILGENIVKVTSTVDCVLALNDKGEVFGWGNSEYGQLETDGDNQQINTPVFVKATRNCGKIVDIAAGGSYCMVLNEHGDVFVWGYGVLGVGPLADYIKSPQLIPPPLFGRNDFNPSTRVISIYSGVNHLAAITDQNNLFTWGKNKYGCLGLGHEKDQFFPFKVGIGAKCLKVSCGVDHTLAYCKSFL